MGENGIKLNLKDNTESSFKNLGNRIQKELEPVFAKEDLEIMVQYEQYEQGELENNEVRAKYIVWYRIGKKYFDNLYKSQFSPNMAV